MTEFKDSPVTFQATEVLEMFRRVKLSAAVGYVEYADQSDSSSFIGSTIGLAAAIDDSVAVSLKKAARVEKATAAGPFAYGAALYAANDGKVDDAVSGNVIGTALEAATADGDIVKVIFDGGLSATILAARTNITQDNAAAYTIPLTDLRTWDNMAVNIPATAGTDDLALVTGTAGAAAPQVEGADYGGTTEAKYTSFMFKLPIEYVAGQAITLRVKALMKVISDTTAILDAQVYRQAAPTVDICATAQQSINSATAANKDFTITPTDCVPGDLLRVVLAVSGSDSGNAAPNITAVIQAIQMLLSVKG